MNDPQRATALQGGIGAHRGAGFVARGCALALSIALGGCGGPASDGEALATLEQRCLAEERPSVAPEAVTLSAIDGGRLALVLHGADVRPQRGPVFVVDPTGQRRLDVPVAAFVRFLDAEHLLVSGAPRDAAGPGSAFVVAADGRRIESFDPGRIGPIEPAPDGRRFVTVAWPSHESAAAPRLVIRELTAPTLDLVARSIEGRSESAFWSPEGDALAIDRVVGPVAASRTRERGIESRLLISSPALATLRVLESDDPAGASRPGGVRVLGWTREGILGESDRALVRCDPDRGGCVQIAGFGDGDRPLALAAGRPGIVYVASTEHSPCSQRLSEVHRERARRIDRVELATGRVETLLRLPPGIAIGDLDWTPLPAAGSERP